MNNNKVTGELKMATNKKKFTEEEIAKLKDVRMKFSELSHKLGQNEIQKLAVEDEKRQLVNLLNTTIKLEKELASELLDKYGKGTIDVDSGEFIPAV
tara:strand:- start:111 stop:401 length:291 start_codon:yes stop_codon:yes gene_type:complete